MSRLGDVLELLSTADDRWTTLRADGRAWRHGAVALEAFLGGLPERRRSRMAAPGRDAVRESEESWRVWLAGRTNRRAEFTVEDDPYVVVRDGASWWSWSPRYGRQTNDGRPNMEVGLGPALDLLEPAGTLGLLNIDVVNEGRLAGRPAFLVRATPGQGLDVPENLPAGAPGLGVGADEYLLHVDAERGVLLRSEARLRGRPFRIVEMRSVAFDEAFEPGIFDPPGPAAEEVVSLQDDRLVPIDELANAAGFPVWVPERVRADATIDATISPAIPRLGVPAAVRVTYATFDPDEDEPFWLSLVESREPMPAPPEVAWREEGELRVGSPDRTGRARVRLFRAGTHVELTGEGMAERDLLAFSRSLVPLPPGPPALAPRRA